MNFDKEFTIMRNEKGVDTVVVLGHINPDGDALGCVMGLAHYIRDHYPEIKVLPYLADNLGNSLKQVVVADLSFDPFEMPCVNERYMAIVCDTATEDRIAGRELYDQASGTMVIDHHESNPGYGDVTEIEFRTSCAENIVHMLDAAKLRVTSKYPSVADYLYIGMIHDTKVFENITGPSTMEASSTLLRAGVDHKKAVSTFHSETLDDFVKESCLSERIERYADNRIACLCINRDIAEKENVVWDNVKNTGNKVSKLRGVDIVLIMYEKEYNKWRISCRTDGINFNANKYLQPYGGGGHDHAAGLILETGNIETMKKAMIKEMIADVEAKS